MLIQDFPGANRTPSQKEDGASLRSIVASHAAGFLRATRPRARTGAGWGGTALLWGLRSVLWVDLQLVALAAILAAYVLAGAGRAGKRTGVIVPQAIAAILIVMAMTVFRVVMLPLKHLALTAVAIGVTLEALLVGRVYLQVAYDPDVEGFGGTVLSLTDTLVSPFRSFEGTALLRDTGVVEFATLTAMEAYLVATIGVVLVLMFWSEFLHAYRRVAGFFAERAERRHNEPVAIFDDAPEGMPAADLSAAS